MSCGQGKKRCNFYLLTNTFLKETSYKKLGITNILLLVFFACMWP